MIRRIASGNPRRRNSTPRGAANTSTAVRAAGFDDPLAMTFTPKHTHIVLDRMQALKEP